MKQEQKGVVVRSARFSMINYIQGHGDKVTSQMHILFVHIMTKGKRNPLNAIISGQSIPYIAGDQKTITVPWRTRPAEPFVSCAFGSSHYLRSVDTATLGLQVQLGRRREELQVSISNLVKSRPMASAALYV